VAEIRDRLEEILGGASTLRRFVASAGPRLFGPPPPPVDIVVGHGDIYVASEKATGYDWRMRSKTRVVHSRRRRIGEVHRCVDDYDPLFLAPALENNTHILAGSRCRGQHFLVAGGLPKKRSKCSTDINESGWGWGWGWRWGWVWGWGWVTESGGNEGDGSEMIRGGLGG
jgi:hypothetical protein